MGNKVARHRMGTRLCNAYFSVLFWFLKYVNELAFIKKSKNFKLHVIDRNLHHEAQ